MQAWQTTETTLQSFQLSTMHSSKYSRKTAYLDLTTLKYSSYSDKIIFDC